MMQNPSFIKATEEYNTFETQVPSYYFRKTYTAERETVAKITVAACGFYEIYLNGEKITRGFLSPYVSNPNHYVYADEYTVTLREGKNVIALQLGNGFQNNPGGYIWFFDEADFRSAPSFALTVTDAEGGILTTSEEGFRTAPSPIRSDDYRFGEWYDANYEIEGWNSIELDDTAWGTALPAKTPLGEIRVADTDPIVLDFEIEPVRILPAEGGYIYDFGVSHAGVCRLRVKGTKGQKITLQHADDIRDGELAMENVWFKREMWERDLPIVHKDTYICRGEGIEEYQPTFTYHGFRYVKVEGITEEQATKELLTYLVYHTKLDSLAGFSCSDPIANKLYELTERSIISNFHHFPTDCPQREKNGWTADAALAAEIALITFTPERNYREWVRNICRAQNERGAIPGIVPTAGWGFDWGNGPAWDSVLTWLPYYVYIYRGKTEMITESAPTFIKYLRYLRTRVDENGLLAIGLGDWLHVGGLKPPKAPLILTDSLMAMDIATKTAFMLDAIGMTEEAEYARGEAKKYRAAIRANLIDYDTMLVRGNCQSSQAMTLHYGVFEGEERKVAFDRLLEFIHAADDHIDLGVLGGRVIFHVLTEFGYSDLAFKMITREDYPSFGNWIKRGATTLWENFHPTSVSSMNHHFWGDFCAWFIKRIVGIQLNPTGRDVNTVKIAPAFIDSLTNASAYHVAPAGKIAVAWEKVGEKITLTVEIPEGVSASFQLEEGFALANGDRSGSITCGTYTVERTK